MRRFQIVPSISNSRCVFQQSRNFANASSFYNKKMYQANHDSARQAKDYMDRVQPPELHRKVDSMLRPKVCNLYIYLMISRNVLKMNNLIT